MRINFKEGLFSDNYFSKSQDLYTALHTLTFFDEIQEIFNKDSDEFIIEYDASVDSHILLHKSNQFKETRPVCYMNQDQFSMKAYLPFIIQCLEHAWAEYLI